VSVLLLRLLLAPAFIVGASLVGRRLGVRLGGVVAGLPVVAGPILLVLALDHGAAFARSAATGTMLGLAALIAFVLAYAAVSARFAWPVALAAGWTSFLAVIGALDLVHVGPVGALAVACGSCFVALKLLPAPGGMPPEPYRHPWWDLPLRALCGLVLVVAVTAAAGALGPHLSGLLAAFPIITAVLTAFTHAQRGRREAERLLHGFALGFVAYALFLFALSVSIRSLGIGLAFALATVVTLSTQAAVLALTRSR
jgi:uncharacterized membrane protein (GlpM family)